MYIYICIIQTLTRSHFPWSLARGGNNMRTVVTSTRISRRRYIILMLAWMNIIFLTESGKHLSACASKCFRTHPSTSYWYFILPSQWNACLVISRKDFRPDWYQLANGTFRNYKISVYLHKEQKCLCFKLFKVLQYVLQWLLFIKAFVLVLYYFHKCSNLCTSMHKCLPHFWLPTSYAQYSRHGKANLL